MCFFYNYSCFSVIAILLTYMSSQRAKIIKLEGKGMALSPQNFIYWDNIKDWSSRKQVYYACDSIKN